MNQALQTVFFYHETTKHAQHRYARSLGYMDWDTQPNPFREYTPTKKVDLPLAHNNATPPYHLLETNLPTAPLCLESLSQFFQFSLAIAAHKEAHGNRWAVRCNASSGNLHPTEAYLIIPPNALDSYDKTSIFHYAPKNHELEYLSGFHTSFWNQIPHGSFLIGLSSITWREAWKYGERAFRYTQLDAGHAWQALNISAKMLGWKCQRIDSLHDNDIATLLGLNQENRFSETEHPDMLFVISPSSIASNTNMQQLIQDVPLLFDGIANKLSPEMHNWDILHAIEHATRANQIRLQTFDSKQIVKEPTINSGEIILKRRSVQIMHKEISQISKNQFHTLLKSVASSLDAKEPSAHLVLFVHQVKEYEKGLYILIRNPNHLKQLKKIMKHDFRWSATSFDNLYLLTQNNFEITSKEISCSQSIASDGAFSLGMLCEFSSQLQSFGSHRYKELYWECGMIGQQLYLEATSLGLSGTGIGCFLDDAMHNLLGIKDNSFQIMYHFTIGKGGMDSRIMTQPAYKK